MLCLRRICRSRLRLRFSDSLWLGEFGGRLGTLAGRGGEFASIGFTHFWFGGELLTWRRCDKVFVVVVVLRNEGIVEF